METGCLQVPDWTGQRCWLGSSSCCCCCWCFPRQSSWCFPPTSSFSGACWAAAAPAPLVEEGDMVSAEKEPVPPSPFSANTLFLQGPFSPQGSIARLLPSTASLSPQCRGQERAQGRFLSLLCLPQAAGSPPGRELPATLLRPSGKAGQQMMKPAGQALVSLVSQEEARDRLWGWEKTVLRAGPEQAALETWRQHHRQWETHQAERPSAATSGRGKS